MNVLCTFCHAKLWMAECLSKSSVVNPLFGMCCLQGKLSLPPLEPLPAALKHLFEDDTPHAKHFRAEIMHFNCALAMTSLGESACSKLHVDHTINDGHGPWVFKVQGAMHHIIGCLQPNVAYKPSYAQLYFFDPAVALERRLSLNPQIHRAVLQEVQAIIYEHHPFVAMYYNALELTANLPEDSNCKITIRYTPGTDHR